MREIKFRAYGRMGFVGDHRMIDWEELRFSHYKLAVLNVLETEGIDLQIMQYTGLKDKNGKEIYEGDVVKSYWQHDGMNNFDYEVIGKIVWFNDTSCFTLENKEHGYKFLTTYEREELIELEVIGNIWENPSLITGA